MFGLAYFHVQALQVVFFALGLFGAYATYKRACVLYGVPESTAVFPEIVNGNIVYMIFPGFTPAWWYYPVYSPPSPYSQACGSNSPTSSTGGAVPATLQTRFITM